VKLWVAGGYVEVCTCFGSLLGVFFFVVMVGWGVCVCVDGM